MELIDVKGIGPSAVKKLQNAGIDTVVDLINVDLRSTNIEGLSTENLTKTRTNADRLAQAQRSGDLTLVEGLGPSARDKLANHGVKTIEDLTALDLRGQDVKGLSTKKPAEAQAERRVPRDRLTEERSEAGSLSVPITMPGSVPGEP